MVLDGLLLVRIIIVAVIPKTATPVSAYVYGCGRNRRYCLTQFSSMATACAAGDDCGYTYRIEDVVVVLEGVANDDGRGAVDLTGVTSIVVLSSLKNEPKLSTFFWLYYLSPRKQHLYTWGFVGSVASATKVGSCRYSQSVMIVSNIFFGLTLSSFGLTFCVPDSILTTKTAS